MRLPALVPVLLLAACATEPSEFDLDADAAEAIASGKSDGVSFERLERTTVAEAVAAINESRGGDLGGCFDAYKVLYDEQATYLTPAVIDTFAEIEATTWGEACVDPWTLQDIAAGILSHRDVSRTLFTTALETLPAWATAELADSVDAEGFVDPAKAPLTLRDDVVAALTANARSREKNPTGVSLRAIRDAWDDNTYDTTADHAYLNPVRLASTVIASDDLFRHLRAAFPQLRGLSLESSGLRAVTDFAAESPDGEIAFAPITAALRKTSIKKRYYFLGSDSEGADSRVLIVIDEHGQAFGMQVGYSD